MNVSGLHLGVLEEFPDEVVGGRSSRHHLVQTLARTVNMEQCPAQPAGHCVSVTQCRRGAPVLHCGNARRRRRPGG